nr:hypothetical protein [Lachnospiraceae bacterium]
MIIFDALDKMFLKNLRNLLCGSILGIAVSCVVGLLMPDIFPVISLGSIIAVFIKSIYSMVVFIKNHNRAENNADRKESALLLFELFIGLEIIMTFLLIYTLIGEIIKILKALVS